MGVFNKNGVLIILVIMLGIWFVDARKGPVPASGSSIPAFEDKPPRPPISAGPPAQTDPLPPPSRKVSLLDKPPRPPVAGGPGSQTNQPPPDQMF
ncbi:hypothetical protein M5689_019885 [Euphorbia peplus]|nr:hypothetical protein M5689_019885 [Euphorbia peplus]